MCYNLCVNLLQHLSYKRYFHFSFRPAMKRYDILSVIMRILYFIFGIFELWFLFNFLVSTNVAYLFTRGTALLSARAWDGVKPQSNSQWERRKFRALWRHCCDILTLRDVTHNNDDTRLWKWFKQWVLAARTWPEWCSLRNTSCEVIMGLDDWTKIEV